MGDMSTKAKVIAIIVAVVVIMVGTIIGYRKIDGIFNPKKAEPEITTTIVSRQLQTMQDLTTAKENDYGVLRGKHRPCEQEEVHDVLQL